MSYVPNYLQNVARGAYGWPEGVSSEESAALTSLVAEAMTCMPLPPTLNEIRGYSRRDSVSARYKSMCPTFYSSVLLDYTYCCLDRAARAAGAVQTWRLPAELKTKPMSEEF